MLKRVLEPEVMDTEQDALEYLGIDNEQVNREFADRVVELAPATGSLLDAGTGPGDIAILIARAAPRLIVTAIDLGEHMLALARSQVQRAGLQRRIRVERADAKATGFPDSSFDMIVSNSLVHHVPEPVSFFREVARLARAGAGIFIKDLHRPATRENLERLVTLYASEASDYQRRLFANSLHAALTLDEVLALCSDVRLSDASVRCTSDRHWVVERPAAEGSLAS